MAIDRADYHLDDAKALERACRHIALFLRWAAERGLASKLHDPKKMDADAVAYFIARCDAKLWDDDFNREGKKFVLLNYHDYLDEVGNYARVRGVGYYEVPADEATEKHFFEWLDERLR